MAAATIVAAHWQPQQQHMAAAKSPLLAFEGIVHKYHDTLASAAAAAAKAPLLVLQGMVHDYSSTLAAAAAAAWQQSHRC